jgi:hypothetical protein
MLKTDHRRRKKDDPQVPLRSNAREIPPRKEQEEARVIMSDPSNHIPFFNAEMGGHDMVQFYLFDGVVKYELPNGFKSHDVLDLWNRIMKSCKTRCTQERTCYRYKFFGKCSVFYVKGTCPLADSPNKYRTKNIEAYTQK